MKTCKHCGHEIVADFRDSHGNMTNRAVWRTENGRCDCAAESATRDGPGWHVPKEVHSEHCESMIWCGFHRP